MKYRHTFRVHAPLTAVAVFHARSSSMAAITPPPVTVRIREAPETLAEGDEMDFTLWFGPLPVNWLARIEEVSMNGFTDRQLLGPFRRWIHRHTFLPINGQVTEVRDEIEIALKPHWIWGLVGLSMLLSLPILFAYRSWKTRTLLEGKWLASS